MASLAVVLLMAPASAGTAAYVPVMGAMAKMAAWVIGPSMVLTVVSGLLAIAANPGFHEAGWAWVKAATGILILEGGLHVMGPLQEEAKRRADLPDPASVARLLTSEVDTLWVLLAVSVANVALAIWRPRLPKSRV